MERNGPPPPSPLGTGRHATTRGTSEETPADTTAPSFAGKKGAPASAGIVLVMIFVRGKYPASGLDDDDWEMMGHNIIDDDGRKWPPSEKDQVCPSTSLRQRPARSLVARMASSVKTFLACSLLAFVSVHAAHRSHGRDTLVRQTAVSPPVVTVKNGSYEGLYSPEYDQDFFLGMRYAQVGSHPAISSTQYHALTTS